MDDPLIGVPGASRILGAGKLTGRLADGTSLGVLAAVTDNTLAGEASLARYVGDARLPALGRGLGEELAAGGQAPLWTALAEQIVAERSGSEKRPADGVIVVRTAGKQYDGTAAFLDLSTGYGHVQSEIGASEAPASGEAIAEVRARSGAGDITVRRA